MTLQEFQALAQDISVKASTHLQKSSELVNFANGVNAIANGQFASTLFPNDQAVDAFISAETAPYVALLTAIETAADDLGTDPFH